MNHNQIKRAVLGMIGQVVETHEEHCALQGGNVWVCRCTPKRSRVVVQPDGTLFAEPVVAEKDLS